MQIADLSTFRLDFDAEWQGASAIFYESGRDALALVDVDDTPMSDAHASFALSIVENFLSTYAGTSKLSVRGLWDHLTVTRLCIKGSAVIGGWWIWKAEDVVQSVMRANEQLATKDADDSVKTEVLKTAYRTAVARHLE